MVVNGIQFWDWLNFDLVKEVRVVCIDFPFCLLPQFEKEGDWQGQLPGTAVPPIFKRRRESGS